MNIVDMSYQAFCLLVHEPSSLVDPESDMSMDIYNLSYKVSTLCIIWYIFLRILKP